MAALDFSFFTFDVFRDFVLKGLLGMYFCSFLWLDPRGPRNADDIGNAFADIVLKAVLKK